MSGCHPLTMLLVRLSCLNPSFSGIWCRVIVDADYEQLLHGVLILLLVEYGVG